MPAISPKLPDMMCIRVSGDFPGWPADSKHFRVTLRYGAKSMSAIRHQAGDAPGRPDLRTVLYSLFNDAEYGSMTFPDFCATTGCNADSRKDEAVWKDCASTRIRLTKLLGPMYDTIRTHIMEAE